MPTRKPGSGADTTTQARTNALYDTGGGSETGGTALPPIGSTTIPRTTQTYGRGEYAPVTSTQRSTAIGSTANPYLQTAAVTNAATGAPAPGFGDTGYPGSGTNPTGGWAASMGYTPADVMGMNQMPARYLYDILAQRGMDPTGGLFYMMEPLADVMMPVYELIYGRNGSMTTGFDPNNIANFMGNMWGELQTPGGRGFAPAELWQNMLNPGSNSILHNYLNTGTPEEQVENLRRYAMMVGQLSGSPMYQQALSNYLSRQGYDYLNAFQGGQQPGYTFGNQIGGVGM